MGIKVILDTDIGTDIDDAWALALCLAVDELDLIGVTLVHADLETRARIALKMLKLAGRDDIPVYNGISMPLTPGAGLYWAGHEGADTDFSDISGMRARDGAVDFILETVDRYPGEVALCPVGPLTNIGEAFRRSPETMAKLGKLAIMGATYEGAGPAAAAREHNASVDPVATKLVLESRVPATVVGLNVTAKVVVRMDDVRTMHGSPFGDYLAAMTDHYCRLAGRDFTYMHDPLAVATLFDPSVTATRPMRAEVLDDGCVVWSAASDESGALDVSVDVDADRFENMLVSRIRSFAQKGD